MAHVTSYLHAAAAAEPASGAATGPLFLCEGRATSARQASARVAALAAGLSQQLGMQVGDRVCLAALATDSNLEALLAITAAGGVAAPLNWRWSPAEAAHAAQLVDARLLLADAACLPFALQLAAVRPGAFAALVLLGPPDSFRQADLDGAGPGAGSIRLAFAEALIAGCPDVSLHLQAAPGNSALIVYTSGTTGKPKGVVLSHSALHSQSMAKLLTCGYCAADVYLHAAPLFHIGGLSSALAMLAAGARHIFLPRFDGPALLGAIQQHSVTSFIAVPAMVADLLAAASQAGVAQLPSLTRILVGGGGMSPQLQQGLADLCPTATVHTAYGMTEGASSLTFATLWGPRGASSSGSMPATSAAAQGPPGGVFVGRPPPGIELAVYQLPPGSLGAAGGGGSSGGGAGGRVRQEGEGEVLTRGPHVMLGYWDDEEATAAAQLPGGWMRTGDLGCLRQGQLWLMGRAKDMIKSGGENVHAWEVERALATHPAVALAAVVGASHWRLGEAVAAAVVLRPGWRWAGERCQVLLQQGQKGAGAGAGRQVAGQQAAARSALEAAAAAMAPAPAGSRLGGAEDMEDEGEKAAGAAYVEDLHSTLHQRSPSRPGSSQRVRAEDEGGLLAALLLDPSPDTAQHQVLQQLQSVAAGLELVATSGQASQKQGGGSGGASRNGRSSGSSSAGSAGDACVVDGHLLQQHCRAAGLAGFKLPRVFLHCDAASPAAAGSAVRSGGGGGVVLPVNSTGKVVKHLLKQQVQEQMQAASSAAARPSPRSRL